MKLANLFMMTMLVGTVAAIGCSDDTNGTAGGGGNGGTGGSGTAGTGGGGVDPCTGNNCDLTEPKLACEAAVAFCKGPDCCSGAGGAGGGVDPTDEQCDGFGEALCTIDFGGTGGTGGAGGGTGGAGGGTGGAGGGGSDGPTAEEVCAYCDSDEQIRIDECEETFDQCIVNPPSGPPENVLEKCAVLALSRCGG